MSLFYSIMAGIALFELYEWLCRCAKRRRKAAKKQWQNVPRIPLGSTNLLVVMESEVARLWYESVFDPKRGTIGNPAIYKRDVFLGGLLYRGCWPCAAPAAVPGFPLGDRLVVLSVDTTQPASSCKDSAGITRYLS